jgi:Flp pilus assembly protein TadG
MPKAFNEMPHLMNAPRSTHARRFLRDTGGSILPIFVVVMFVVIAMIGMAIDYTRGSLANTKMQAALDATALALSSTAASLTSAALTTQATTYFNGIYTGAALGAPTITATYSNVTNPQLVMSATAVMKTSFLGLPPLNMSTINVSAASTIAWGESRLRVALVLDNTGSMADSGKIGALQTATKNLLAQLKAAAANNGDVYVSIIPFVKDVNVGDTNYNATWIDWTDWNATNGTCSRGIGISQSTCILGTWTPAAHSTWNGCITDRGLPAPTSTPSPQNYDTNVTAPSAGTVATLFPAEQYDSCPLQMKGLSYDWTSMNTLVNQMAPSGNTNQAIGLAWGWLSLVGGGPLTAPALDPNYQYQQVIILLTDGLNTQDRWYTSQNSIDARQQITCNNIKAAGITLYTVQVDTGGDPTSTLLQGCASDASKFFLLKSASAIITTFTTIGNTISKLHIAK